MTSYEIEIDGNDKKIKTNDIRRLGLISKFCKKANWFYFESQENKFIIQMPENGKGYIPYYAIPFIFSSLRTAFEEKTLKGMSFELNRLFLKIRTNNLEDDIEVEE